MTALDEFQRLECQAIWRPASDAQWRNVIVAVGKATLTMSNQQDTAITHWSLPAIERINPGELPANYRPGPDATDNLEIGDETMIRAIEKVQAAVQRAKPHPGRLRFSLIGGATALVTLLAIFWLPGAMVQYTVSVVPAAKRTEIGEDLLANIVRVAGRPCDTILGLQSLQRLQIRLFDAETGKIVVLAGGVQRASHLPGSIILLNRALVEDHEQVAVAAGYVIVENLRSSQSDPLLRLLDAVGLWTSLRLLTTGNIPESVLASYAETLLTADPLETPEKTVLAQFQRAKIPSSPYAYAVDISGETTLGLIEADATIGRNAPPILDDADWVSLQGICGE